uniref:Akuammiline synthase 2 n=1 Tax=Alstonia scholaris TaxID=52822 RepID=AKS2_ALSSC|nr:akuammiline synthase [Alstonia scholaris]
MNITILSKETIKPLAPTPHHHKYYKVSLLDQFAPSSYMPFIFFYPNKFADRDAAGILTQLKESLSQILTIYYPLAGRVKDTVYVECNDEGVEFIEAQANGSLSDFLKQPDIAALNNFLPRNGNGLEKGCSISPVAIKATVFECSGIVLGVCIFHKVVDAAAAGEFLQSWAKIGRGSKETVELPNFTSASSLFPPRESLSSKFVRDFDNFFFQGSKSFMRRFVFDATAITTLRTKATSEKVPNPSRVEALMEFVVQHLSTAFKTAKSETPETLMITHPVNLRKRIEPPLPDSTFGNVIWLAFAFYDCDPSETKIKPGDVVERVREAFAALDKESISELETDDAFTSLSELLESVYTNEKIKIYRFTSTCNMGFYDVDFGWGKPVWVAHMGNMVDYRCKQQIVFMETGHMSKDIELWLAAEEDELSVLEKNAEFLAYATPNPTIWLDSDGTN